MPTGEFEALVREHARLMAAAIYRVCGRRHQSLVPDVQQEVYLALWKKLQSGKKIEHPVSYVYKVALTTALALVRKLEREAVAPDENDVARVADRATAGPRELMPAERTQLIAEVLDTLGPDEARALRAYLAGFNHREVAELYGWTESTARHRIYRSIEALSETFRSEEEHAKAGS